MTTVSNQKAGFTVKAHRGDAKTLIAYSLAANKVKKLAGFTDLHFADRQLFG